MSYCIVLSDKDSVKPEKNAVNSTVSSNENVKAISHIVHIEEEGDIFAEFRTEGKVALTRDHPKVSVALLRDTGASQCLMLRKCLPSVNERLTGTKLLLKDFNYSLLSVELVVVHLECNETVGDVSVGQVDEISLPGRDFLLGNDLAGGLLVPNVLVRDRPLEESPTLVLEKEQPNMFPVCAVTRDQKKKFTTKPENQNSGPISQSFTRDSY